nr:PilZ domain-containing protein [uncultured Pseudodesulfovibrio sp.]
MTPKNTIPENTTLAPATKVVVIPGVKMNITLGKEVVIRIPGTEQSYRGKIVGYDPYKYLIANVRLPSRIRQELALDGQIILKYFHQGTVYGFKATVQNAITSPSSLIFFDYPSVIEKIELRRKERTKCHIDGALHSSDGAHDCLIVNVSETGCKISTHAGSRDTLAATQVDDTLFVVMNLGADGTLKLPIVVRNAKREQGILTIGAMFLDIMKEEESRIRKYLTKIQKHTHQPRTKS